MTKMDFEPELARNIRQAGRKLVRELDVLRDGFQGSGFSASQCHVMFELFQGTSLTLTQLADQLLMDKSNLSRTVSSLLDSGAVSAEKSPHDQRQKWYRLTRQGQATIRQVVREADQKVSRVMEQLTRDECQTIIKGMELYGWTLEKIRLQAPFEIRQMQKKDEAQVARLIREVMTEFGAVGEGYSINDPEVDHMWNHYRSASTAYLVIVREDRVFGGGGIGPLTGGDEQTCELRKMFFRPELRGIGMGSRLLKQLLQLANEKGYAHCYLETLERMGAANELYRAHGFVALKEPMGKTGHSKCDRFYLKSLKKN